MLGVISLVTPSGQNTDFRDMVIGASSGIKSSVADWVLRCCIGQDTDCIDMITQNQWFTAQRLIWQREHVGLSDNVSSALLNFLGVPNVNIPYRALSACHVMHTPARSDACAIVPSLIWLSVWWTPSVIVISRLRRIILVGLSEDLKSCMACKSDCHAVSRRLDNDWCLRLHKVSLTRMVLGEKISFLWWWLLHCSIYSEIRHNRVQSYRGHADSVHWLLRRKNPFSDSKEPPFLRQNWLRRFWASKLILTDWTENK